MHSIRLSKTTRFNPNSDFIFVSTSIAGLKSSGLSKDELARVKEQLTGSKGTASLERNGQLIFIAVVNEKTHDASLESARKAGNSMLTGLDRLKRKEVQISGSASQELLMALAEGMMLGSYVFDEYKTKDRKKPGLRALKLHHSGISSAIIRELVNVTESVYWARDLVNRPLSHMTASDLAKEIKSKAKDAGYKVDVFNKAKIKALKMGGLLAVNIGSPDPPTFSVMEWKPKNAKNKKPVLLVGKGVVYDTGGLSLKPTPNSMDMMKCDMAGAACMAAVVHAVAKQRLPIHVVALIPATDNRPGGNAYAPGDVITMHDGQTVEILNTDAEGRLILADAHSYGKRYKPELVIDAATLTGAAIRAIGTEGVVAMGTASDKAFKLLSTMGYQVHERIAQMPFWDEYDEELKSDIADMKNLGGSYAGQITAGKFLARFVSDPFIHLDIAGPAYLPSRSSYRPTGGTGVGVRLLYHFLRNYTSM